MGLLLLTCPNAETLQENETVQINCKGTPQVKNAQGHLLTCHDVPSFLMDMVNAGGLVKVLKQRMADKALGKTDLYKE